MDNLNTFWKQFLGDATEDLITKLSSVPIDCNLYSSTNIINNIQKAQKKYFTDLTAALDKSVSLLTKNNTRAPENDRRFKDEAWNQHPIFCYLKESYLAYTYFLNYLVKIHSTDKKQQEKYSFHLKNYLDAVSPTNFPFTNPEVIRESIKQQGANFLRGYKSFLDDHQGSLAFKLPPLTDVKAFQVGENLAISKGNVVFQNNFFQLLQYLPSGNYCHQRPLLIIPPWINKYYIFDLRPENSFIKWNLENSRAVYVISWVNPGQEYKESTLEDYLLNGIDVAVDYVRDLFKTPGVNAIGFCVGGVGLLTLMAYYQKKKQQKITSATLLASPVDFKKMGDLSFFVDNEYVSTLKNITEKIGGVGGDTMMQMFRSLRANELIWPSYIDTYLLGKKPKALDLLYWNSDTTNLPARMHLEYLEKFYIGNCLNKVNHYVLNKIGINIGIIKTPSFILATERDHIVPWKAAYRGFQRLKNSTFILGGAGHIAGIINPPSQKKYGYRTNNTTKRSITPDQWLKESVYHPNSWWEMWGEWVKPFCGPLNKPIDDITYHAIEKTPGNYALQKAPDLY